MRAETEDNDDFLIPASSMQFSNPPKPMINSSGISQKRRTMQNIRDNNFMTEIVQEK